MYLLLTMAILLQTPQARADEVESCLRRNYLYMGDGITAKEAKWTNDERASMGKMRDQDSVGSCYAYAATDMYEHYLKKQGLITPPKSGENTLSALAVDIQVQSDQIKEQVKSAKDYVKVNEESIKITSQQIERNKKNIAEGKDVAKNQEELKMYEDWLLLLKKDKPVFKNGRQQIKVKYSDGGQTKQALAVLKNNYCLETEIASRDQGLRRKIEAAKSKPSSTPIPANFKEVLSKLLGTGNPDDSVAQCFDLSLVREIFPRLTDADLARVQQLMKQDEDMRRNPLLGLLESACKKKTAPMPELIQTTAVNDTFPVKDNDEVFETLDRLLSAKGTAVVNLHASIFGSDTDIPRKGDEHSVSIVGTGTVCGRPHYILRNSWGAGACERAKEDFGLGHPGSGVRAPFGCDVDGNFIIQKSALQRGTYEVTGFRL